jgi:hypothetical protein
MPRGGAARWEIAPYAAPGRVVAAPLNYFFGPGSAGRRDRPICGAAGGGSACLPGGSRDGWPSPNISGRPPLPVYIGLPRSLKMAQTMITPTPTQKRNMPYSTYSHVSPSNIAAIIVIAAM